MPRKQAGHMTEADPKDQNENIACQRGRPHMTDLSNCKTPCFPRRHDLRPLSLRHIPTSAPSSAASPRTPARGASATHRSARSRRLMVFPEGRCGPLHRERERNLQAEIGSFVEQIRMCSDSGESQCVAFDGVEKQPIGLYVKIAKTGPFAFQRVIPLTRGKRLALDQEGYDCFEILHVLAALLCALHIALEPPSSDWRQHFKCPSP